MFEKLLFFLRVCVLSCVLWGKTGEVYDGREWKPTLEDEMLTFLRRRGGLRVEE